MTSLIKFGASLGILGGALRLIAIFIPYTPETAWLETLYAIIDLGFLFGLIAIFASCADRLGLIGLVGFVVALPGVASIVGPDAQMFGLDFYMAGSAVFIIGLAVQGGAMLYKREQVLAAAFWIVSAAIGIAGSASVLPHAIEIAAAALALGFITAGTSILRRASAPHPEI
jgi:hypothetical protein